MAEQDDAVKQLDAIWSGMEERFPKPYSKDRLEQLRQSLQTARMAILHLFDEEYREEHEDRLDQQIKKMVRSHNGPDGPTLSPEEARKRVEAGERV